MLLDTFETNKTKLSDRKSLHLVVQLSHVRQVCSSNLHERKKSSFISLVRRSFQGNSSERSTQKDSSPKKWESGHCNMHSYFLAHIVLLNQKVTHNVKPPSLHRRAESFDARAIPSTLRVAKPNKTGNDLARSMVVYVHMLRRKQSSNGAWIELQIQTGRQMRNFTMLLLTKLKILTPLF